MGRLNVGPGEPGPGDEWKFPAGSVHEIEGSVAATREPARAGSGLGLLHRLMRRS